MVIAEGLPDDPPDTSGKSTEAAAPEPVDEPFDEGCIVKFEVQGDLPQAMPQGRQLRSLLGSSKDSGLAFVGYKPVRFCVHDTASYCLLQR